MPNFSSYKTYFWGRGFYSNKDDCLCWDHFHNVFRHCGGKIQYCIYLLGVWLLMVWYDTYCIYHIVFWDSRLTVISLLGMSEPNFLYVWGNCWNVVSVAHGSSLLKAREQTDNMWGLNLHLNPPPPPPPSVVDIRMMLCLYALLTTEATFSLYELSVFENAKSKNQASGLNWYKHCLHNT